MSTSFSVHFDKEHNYCYSQKKNKKGGKANSTDESSSKSEGTVAPIEQSVPGAINVNNMDLAKLKKAIDEMQSVKVRLKIVKAYLYYSEHR